MKKDKDSIRIGVFICHCGSNIGGVINCEALANYAEKLPLVSYSEDNLYTCSEIGLSSIKNAINQNSLNRIVVASCTPRTHEPLFRECITEAGLNPYLFNFVNIREQCSWVHMKQPEEAYEKAKDLIRMGVAKAVKLEPLEKITISVYPTALIIGGGVSGMTAALSLSRQGFKTYIVERERELGGLVRKIQYILGEGDPQEYLEDLIEKVEDQKKIKIFTETEIEDINGYVGNFSTTVNRLGKKKEIETGVIIVATGGIEYKPRELMYGQDDRIMTQLEFEQKITSNEVKAKTVTMIQCVGSRTKERPYCSRICCSEAIKNALKLKEEYPKINVCILYRDIQVYGFKEDYYKEARKKGVIFIRFDEDFEPTIDIKEKDLTITVKSVSLNELIKIRTDLAILSSAFLPTENEKLSHLLKVPLDQNGFFLEAHAKLRPLDFATDGIFLCGAAQWPKHIDETISQALGTAARASTILSKENLNIVGSIAEIDEEMCNGCGNCRDLCNYNAIERIETKVEFKAIHDSIDPIHLTRNKSKVVPAVCKGCGVCVDICPVGAISLKNFTNQQLTAMIESYLI